jgi:hypothetical protein
VVARPVERYEHPLLQVGGEMEASSPPNTAAAAATIRGTSSGDAMCDT